MLKELLMKLDNFLPGHFSETVEAPLLYRGRIIVATNIASLITVFILFIACFLLNLSDALKIGFLVSSIFLVIHLLYIKNNSSHLSKHLLTGATIQVLTLTAVIYFTAFSPTGMGFFGLIWLIPVFLMIAFYFNTSFSFYFAMGNVAIFLAVSFLCYDKLLDPLSLPNFSIIFFIFLIAVLLFSYALAFLFVHLSEDLQREVAKQRDLLVESAKFQSLGQMASNLAHDINNPLFTIQGKLHQMRNLLSRDQLDLKKCDQIVESVETTLLRLSQIVKGISTFAREGRGDQMVSVSVAELIENNLALAMDRIKNLEIDLEMNIDPKANIICYPSFISQVLLNLLNNAIDALENASPKLIEVKAYVEKNWVIISVSDTGPGVAKEIESKIFEPFFTTKTLGKGTGLGLSISKGLVEVHEGILTYERQDNKSVFSVKLPSYE